MPRDRSTIAGAQLQTVTLRRVWSFARPYRAKIAAFLDSMP